jgi:hypothetical protein
MFDVLRDVLKRRYADNRLLYLRALYLNVEVGPYTPDPVEGMYAIDNYKSGDITYDEAMAHIAKNRLKKFNLQQYNDDWQEYLDLCEEEIKKGT